MICPGRSVEVPRAIGVEPVRGPVREPGDWLRRLAGDRAGGGARLVRRPLQDQVADQRDHDCSDPGGDADGCPAMVVPEFLDGRTCYESRLMPSSPQIDPSQLPELVAALPCIE